MKHFHFPKAQWARLIRDVIPFSVSISEPQQLSVALAHIDPQVRVLEGDARRLCHSRIPKEHRAGNGSRELHGAPESRKHAASLNTDPRSVDRKVAFSVGALQTYARCSTVIQ